MNIGGACFVSPVDSFNQVNVNAEGNENATDSEPIVVQWQEI